MSFRWPLNSVAFDATECWPAIDTFDTASNNNDNDNQNTGKAGKPSPSRNHAATDDDTAVAAVATAAAAAAARSAPAAGKQHCRKDAPMYVSRPVRHARSNAKQATSHVAVRD